MKALHAIVLALPMAGLVASPAAADVIDIVRPLPREVVGALRVDAIDVTVSGPAEAAMVDHDAKAVATTGRSDRSGYTALPFTRMAPLVFADTMRGWGLTRGRAVDLRVTIYEFSTGNFGRAMLPGGTRDIVAGFVEVRDARTAATLGMFTVRVVNRHNGWSGMLIRGGGVREKLAAEFALESARVLAGRKSIGTRKRSAAR